MFRRWLVAAACALLTASVLLTPSPAPAQVRFFTGIGNVYYGPGSFSSPRLYTFGGAYSGYPGYFPYASGYYPYGVAPYTYGTAYRAPFYGYAAPVVSPYAYTAPA